MNDPTNDHEMEPKTNNNIVYTDSDSAKLQRARDALVNLILKQRMATFAKTKALGEDLPVAQEPALDLWEEMPQAAQEYASEWDESAPD